MGLRPRARFARGWSSAKNAHAPVKTVKIRSRPCPFVTEEIKDLMKIRKRLHRRFFLTHNEFDWAEYKISRNSVKKALIEAEKHHTYQEVQNKMNNSRSLLKVINNIVPSKTQEKLVYSKDLKTVANEFNLYFSSVGGRTAEAVAKLALENNIICANSSMPDLVSSFDDCFSFTPVSTVDVRRTILSLPLNRAPGPDKTKARVFKDALQVILWPITEIINCSLGTSTFPSDWKIAEVIALLKEGDHEQPPNNRPLSLLNVASKVCVKIVLEQFITYLMSRNRLSSHQSGNKSLHSTETLNIYTTDLILEAMDKGNKRISLTRPLKGF